MDIFNAMKNGLTEEEICAAFSEELNLAKQKIKEITEEEKKKVTVAEARKRVINALKDYYIVTGTIDSDEWDEDIEEQLESSFKSLEIIMKMAGELKKI